MASGTGALNASSGATLGGRGDAFGEGTETFSGGLTEDGGGARMENGEAMGTEGVVAVSGTGPPKGMVRVREGAAGAGGVFMASGWMGGAATKGFNKGERSGGAISWGVDKGNSAGGWGSEVGERLKRFAKGALAKVTGSCR